MYHIFGFFKDKCCLGACLSEIDIEAAIKLGWNLGFYYIYITYIYVYFNCYKSFSASW